MSRGKRNLHDDDLRLRCPGCAKVFRTREGVSNHVSSSLHGEWITDFSIPECDSEVASALRLKALMDGIDAAGGKITVEFPETGAA